MAKLMHSIQRFTSDIRGIAAIEFALVVPVMLVLLTGIIEISNLASAQRRVVEAAHAAADLIAQGSDFSSTDLSDILAASRYVMTPFDDSNMTIGVASVRFDSDGDAYEDWTYAYNGGSVASSTTLANGMGEAGGSVILVSVTYSYTPLLSAIISTTYTLSETAYVRPRNLSYVGYY